MINQTGIGQKNMGRRWLFWIGMILAILVFLYLIRSILLPFILGIFAAYFLDPVSDRLEKWRFSRGLAALTVTAGFFLFLTFILILVVPVITSQLSGLIAAIPGFVADFERRYASEISGHIATLPPLVNAEQGKAMTSDLSGVIIRLLGDFLRGLLQSGIAIVNVLSLILITPIVAFYLLRDWDHITRRIDSYLPRKHADTIRQQLAIIDDTLAGFLRGQITVCLLLGVFYAIGLSLVGLNFGILIGLATGVLVIFPYVGLIVGMGVGLMVAFFQFESLQEVIMVLAVFVVGQFIEGNFVTPKLMGEKVGLHPVWIIFGMLSGAALFGFVGILLAIPATAIIGVLVRFALQHYLKSQYYQENTTPGGA